MVCSPQIQAIRIQSLQGNQNLKAIEMSKGKRRTSGAKLDIMGMSIGCFLSCPLDANNLLPFISKILGYSIIVASTVGKLPQVPESSVAN
jgi:mannose-P-dolichol utilization defect protein 1